MAQPESADGTALSGTLVPAWRQWAAIGLGLLLTWSWVLVIVHFAPDILGTEASTGILSAFTLVLYGALLPFALLAGWLSGTKVLRAGHAPMRWALIGSGLGAGGLGCALLMSWLNGATVPGASATGLGGLVLTGIALTLVQSAMEEVLFRGWLQPVLVQRIGQIAGIVASSITFMAFHLIGGAIQPMSMLVIALAGAMFGMLALRSGGIIAPVMAHAGWNASEDSVFGLVPNPGNEMFGSIVDLDLVGSPWWGGSDEGLNASLGAAVVLCAIILPLLVGKRPSAVAAHA
ncbi:MULTISPECIES: CPBP family intramembrane glutamic endopeptidase [unclassified Novosphingobium]|uniref:CPBP family intramembrane glutamic endopeptidase n=1 Tax=unclassified Novosphingobium TaxID=2644732 RepID=UPI0025D12413|nr:MULTISPECIES: type II CAAX endopeptidase family protein [unclassified Novosphingobium]HQS68514.1 type II CAAX endopeptidase family protein [Novosphingobium sp.]